MEMWCGPVPIKTAAVYRFSDMAAVLHLPVWQQKGREALAPPPFLGAMGKGLHLAYDLNGISGNEKLLVGGNDPYIHLGVISRDALLAADIVSGSIHLDAQELHGRSRPASAGSCRSHRYRR